MVRSYVAKFCKHDVATVPIVDQVITSCM